MLAEIAAANAAFGIIKQAVQNSGDIAKAGAAIASFVGAKEDLQKKVSNKKNSAFHQGNDFEEFMALEEIKQMEQSLKEYMIYSGRPGLWNDWVKFSAEARVARQEAERERQQHIHDMIEYTMIGALVIGLAIILIGLVYLAIDYRGTK